MRRILILVVCGVSAATLCGAAQEVGIAFRYDRDHVLFYVGKMRDPATSRLAEMENLQRKAPMAEYGAGGYLLPLTEERMATFVAVTTTAGDLPRVGEMLTVSLGGMNKVHATVEEYLEQWGMENPIVRVGVLARISQAEDARFEKASAGAFLIGQNVSASLPSTTETAPCTGCKKKVLNRFGALGQLMLEQFDAGWSVALYRETPAGLRRTKVAYDYRD